MTGKRRGPAATPGPKAERTGGGIDLMSSLSRPTPTASTADMVYPIVSLLAELRPDVPISVLASLTVEVLDLASCMILDREWAEARQAAWPEAIKAAHSRHAGHPYSERRAAEWIRVHQRE
jgi:hypothetical protein